MNVKYIVIIAILVFGIGLGFSLHISAEENLIPNWIKSTAGFWVDGQISDSEFISALQFLVEKEILNIPDKNTLDSVDSKEATQNILPKPTPSSEITSDELVPNLVALNMEGGTLWLMIEILDYNGNPVSNFIGEMYIKILNFNDDDIFNRKTYLVGDSFSPYANNISGEDTIAFKYAIQKGKAQQVMYQDYLYSYGLGTLVLSITKNDQVFSNEILLDHLPIEEGYFNEKTGFVKKVDVDKTLKVGNFFVKVMEAGHYVGEDKDDNDKLKDYFRVNLKTKSSQVEGVTFTLDEAYLEDTKGNVYVSDPTSINNYVNSFLGTSFEYEGGNGYLLFEEIPLDTSQLTFTLKISRVEIDNSQTQFTDEIEISFE